MLLCIKGYSVIGTPPIRNISPFKNFSMRKIRYDLRYSSRTIVVSPRILAVLVDLSTYELALKCPFREW